LSCWTLFPAHPLTLRSRFVVANERRVVVAYRVAEVDLECFGPFDEGDAPFFVLVFSEAAFHQFGPPNDEGRHFER
jgi:hypothetical protein